MWYITTGLARILLVWILRTCASVLYVQRAHQQCVGKTYIAFSQRSTVEGLYVQGTLALQ
jgi:hypothetical protein